MKKLYLALLILTVNNFASFGQRTSWQIYIDLYRTADSLNKLGRLYSPDSDVVRQARHLDKKHPAKYFEAIGDMMKHARYDDAAFLFYTGVCRYTYYNAANPKYQASGDGALLGSLKYMAGETVNLYLLSRLFNPAQER